MRCTAFVFLLAASLLAPVGMAEMSFRIVTTSGAPVPHAVLTAGAPLTASVTATASMDQINKKFSPYVLAVPRGAHVDFPNSDQIRHHVYSFSKTKPFELRLYTGTPEAPLHFDAAGVAVLGCNIHDNMVGYIYVSDLSFWALSDGQGMVTVPAEVGADRIGIWHPGLSLTGQRELTLRVSELPRQQDAYLVVLEMSDPSSDPQAVRLDDGNKFKRFQKR